MSGGPARLAYRAASGLRLRSWGEPVEVAYLESTRNTHLVDAGAAIFLRALLAAGGQATVADLWAALDPGAATAEPVDEEPELEMLHQCLERLVGAGLVVRAA